MVSDLKTFAHKGCKIVAADQGFFYLLTPFQRLFARTSQSPMYKLFRFLKSLGESNGKNVVSDLKTVAHKGCNIAAHFFGIGATICISQEILCLRQAGFSLDIVVCYQRLTSWIKSQHTTKDPFHN